MEKIYVLNALLFLTEDTVYIPFEDQREEYIQNDSGLLFMGTALNLVSAPWSFDQVKVFLWSLSSSVDKIIIKFSVFKCLWMFKRKNGNNLGGFI